MKTNMVRGSITQRFRSEVTVTDPFEHNMIPKASIRVGKWKRSSAGSDSITSR